MAENRMQEADNNIIIENRARATVSGVCEVLSFDEREVCMDTSNGRLTVMGDGLHVERLSLDIGEIALAGRIDGFEYLSAQRERSFWSKIF